MRQPGAAQRRVTPPRGVHRPAAPRAPTASERSVPPAVSPLAAAEPSSGEKGPRPTAARLLRLNGAANVLPEGKAGEGGGVDWSELAQSEWLVLCSSEEVE